MRTGLSILAAASVAVVLLVGPASRAEEPSGPPTAEKLDAEEKSGHFAEAIDGWAARYLGVPTAAERAAALKRYVALAEKHPVDADAWLVAAVANSGRTETIVAGRRVVLVAHVDSLGTVDAAKVAALLDAASLVVERVTGTHPSPVQVPPEDKRPRDRSGRVIVGQRDLPKPANEQIIDAWIGPSDASRRGVVLAWSVGHALGGRAMDEAPNRHARTLPAVGAVVADFIAREIGEAPIVALADQTRKSAHERYVADWAPGCLPGEAISDECMSDLFFQALDGERAKKSEPADVMRTFFQTARQDAAWGAGRVARSRELGMEVLAAAFPPSFVEMFRRAGVLPVGAALEDMKLRVEVEKQCREAESLRGDDGMRATVARLYRAAAEQLGGAPAADELLIEALELEEKEDPKKTRAAAKKLGLIEGFDFIGPLPEARQNRDDASAAQRLLPFAVSTAEGRRPIKTKEPADVSLKWGEVKDNYDHLVERTPWGDKRGMSWGGAAVAAIKWTKDMGRMIRVRPCRSESTDVVVLADGRVCERFPDGSSLVPGAKGTEIVLASSQRITCSVPWRDAKSVDSDLAALASEKDAVLALRPWAARRMTAVLPMISDALVKLSDAEFVRDVLLLAPFHGGDAATCDAVLAHARGRNASLAAYLDVCRGTRDAAVLDRIVALGAAADVSPEVLKGVQAVVEAALFRRTNEKGAELAAAWEKGRKWLAATAFAEAEEIRDLHDAWSCFRVGAEANAWGRACIAPTGGRRGEGYLPLEIPAGGGGAFLAVRWMPTNGGRLKLSGYFADGKKQTPFSIDVPSVGADKPQWVLDVFDLGPIPRGGVVMAIDDPCASGFKLDALAVGAKPLE